ncbi:MAG TPA: hypothetical protein VGF30_03420 [Bacteroidia bacterium]
MKILFTMRYLFAILFCGLIFSSCYLGKSIEKPVTVFLDLSEFRVNTYTSAANPQYLNYATEQEYRTAFLNSLSNEATYSKNVTIVYSQPADYTLKLTYFEVRESESKETVNDASSPYNGQSYFLTSIDAKATFDLTRGTDKIDSYTAYSSKSEKLKNNQSLGQMIIGANKDNTQYREKLMQDDVCKDMSDKCGRRTWNLFTQKLAKKMK